MSDDFTAGRRPWRTNAEWERLSERIHSEPLHAAPPRRHVPWRWISVAALAAAAVGIAAVIRQKREAPTSVQHFRTAAGERLAVRLSDSSTITLGPVTTLELRSSSAAREARLDGLAFFDVVHDAKRPFAVVAATARVVDVGTRFVVRAYAAESTVDVAVRTGSVSLASAGRDGALVLRQGEVGVVSRRSGPPRRAGDASPAEYDGWMEGSLDFDDAPLADVATELGRWFDVDVSVADGALARRRVTAVYRNARLTDVLDALSATLHLTYRRSGRNIELAPAPRGPGGSR